MNEKIERIVWANANLDTDKKAKAFDEIVEIIKGEKTEALSKEIYQFTMVETNLWYDDQADKQITVEHIKEMLSMDTGVFYLLEELVQFLDGTLEADKWRRCYELTMKIIKLKEDFT